MNPAHSLVLPSRCALLALAGLLPAAAQEGPAPAAADLGFTTTPSGLRWRAFPVPGSSHVAIVAAVRAGTWHDPSGRTGLAHLLATQVGLTQEERAPADRWSVRYTGPATVFAITCPAAATTDKLHELARFLGGALPFTDDLFARTRARTLRQIDDCLHVVPGPLLFETARRSVLAGTPAGKQSFGVAAEVAAVERDELQQWFLQRVRPEHTTLAVVGAVEPDELAALVASAFTAPGERTPPAVPTLHDSAEPIVAERAHPRVAAPFVSVAIAAPAQSSADWLPFVIAMGVVKLRCYTTFAAYRGGEAEGGFPFFWFDYRHGDAFALINRRGSAAGEEETPRDLAAVQSELTALIKRLRSVHPAYGEIGAAAKEAALTLMLPPYTGQLEQMAQRTGLLMPRAELLAMADVLGWSPHLAADVGKVPVPMVQQALARALADANLRWFALVPGQ